MATAFPRSSALQQSLKTPPPSYHTLASRVCNGGAFTDCLRGAATEAAQESERHHLGLVLGKSTNGIEHQVHHIRRLQDNNPSENLGQRSQDKRANRICQQEYRHDKCLFELGLNLELVADDLQRRCNHRGGYWRDESEA